jgi:sugar phosphate isomerase/epimerase
MTLEAVLEYCAGLGFAAVDPTAYYFPNYPDTPSDSYLYHIKRRSFLLGLDISGTGARNDFTEIDAAKRKDSVNHAKTWIECAARLGAPVLRVFAGRGIPDGHSEREVTAWVVQALRECAEHGARYGVIVVLQNHNDFIRSSGQTLEILRRVDSEWLAMHLDIGSYRIGDPYEEIAKVAPYAATWQIKENVYFGDRETKTDLRRLFSIIKDAGYRGYLPLETLSGDPRVKLPRFLDEVRQALA